MLAVKRIHPNAVIPYRASAGSAGYDIVSIADMCLPPRSSQLIPTGLEMAIPPEYYGQLASRSSLAMRGIDVKAGVIDSDYRNEVKVLLYNGTDTPYNITKGDRIAQLILKMIGTPDVLDVGNAELGTTERKGGFGSTGV